MPVEVSVRADFDQAQRMLSGLRSRAIRRAGVRALNRTASQARTAAAKDMAKEVGQAIGLSKGGLKKSIKHVRANRWNLRAKLVVTGRALPLIRFGARKVKQGVSAAAWGKRKIYKGVFIAKMKSGRKGVFRRTSKDRLPIKELYGPSLPKEFRKKKLVDAMKKEIAITWPKNFQHEMNFELAKYR